MSEKEAWATQAERQKRLPQTVQKILAILEEEGFLVCDLDAVFSYVREAVGFARITRS